MKNFFFIFIIIFIIELFPKIADATTELSFGLGTSFKTSIKYKVDIDIESDDDLDILNDRTFDTSFPQVLLNIPSFFYELPMDMGIGSTSIGVRQNIFIINTKK